MTFPSDLENTENTVYTPQGRWIAMYTLALGDSCIKYYFESGVILKQGRLWVSIGICRESSVGLN